MSSKRHSMMPSAALAGPRAPVHLSSSVTIAESAIVTGAYPVTISSESVIHPRARLDSTGGPVNIGRRCIVHERTHVGAGADPDAADPAEGSVTLGDCVTVEVGAVVETGGTAVGEGTIVGVACRVGRGASIGKVCVPPAAGSGGPVGLLTARQHCTLSPHTVVAAGEKIPDFTVLYSNGRRRQDRRGFGDVRNKAQGRQIEVLRKLIPSNPMKFQ